MRDKEESQLDSIDILNEKLPISQEDREEVMQEIDSLMQKNSTASLTSKLKPNTSKTGLAMPVIVGGGLLFIAIIIVFVAQYLLGAQRESSIVNDSNPFQSIESQLIKEIANRAQHELETKENEIQSIEEELSDSRSILENLVSGVDRNIEIKRQELTELLPTEMEAEQDRLTALGVSVTEIETALVKFRQRRLQEIEQDLGQYRILLEEEISTEQVALQSTIDQLSKSLETRQSELRQLELEIARRQEDLNNMQSDPSSVSELTTQLEQISQNVSEYEKRYQQLLTSQKNVELVTDQIQDQYSIAFASVGRGDYQRSIQALDKLGAILNSVEPTNPLLTTRVAIDKEVANVLRSLLTTKQQEKEQTQRLLDNTRALSETLNSSQESVTQDTLQKQQLENVQRQIQDLQIDLQERDRVINTLKQEVENVQNSLARARALLANRDYSAASDSETTIARAKQIYTDGLIQVQNLLNNGSSAARATARTTFIRAIERTGLFENFAQTMESLEQAPVVQPRTTSDSSEYNRNLNTVISYIAGDSRLQGQVSAIYANDRALEANVRRITALLENAREEATQVAAIAANEIPLGYISRVLGSSEVAVVTLNPTAGRIGAYVVIYSVRGTDRIRRATGVISRIEGTGVTAQIQHATGETKVHENDLVYIQF